MLPLLWKFKTRNFVECSRVVDGLKQDILTPAGWLTMADIVDIKSTKSTLIAEAGSGQSYEYQSDFMKPKYKENSVDYWIFGCEILLSTDKRN